MLRVPVAMVQLQYRVLEPGWQVFFSPFWGWQSLRMAFSTSLEGQMELHGKVMYTRARGRAHLFFVAVI